MPTVLAIELWFSPIPHPEINIKETESQQSLVAGFMKAEGVVPYNLLLRPIGFLYLK